MSKDSLGISLREFLGPMTDFFTKLLSDEGEVWWEGFKRYLRKENPWEIVTKVAQAVQKLFDHVGDLAFPGMKAFKTDSFFTTDTPKGAKVEFVYVGPNFTNWFGGMEVVGTESSKLSLDRLRGDSYDPDITKEIGEENCDQSLAVIRWHIENGKAKKNRWYAGYFKDSSGVRRAVHWIWFDDGWRVDAFEVPDSLRWDGGFEFVSRKPLVS